MIESKVLILQDHPILVLIGIIIYILKEDGPSLEDIVIRIYWR